MNTGFTTLVNGVNTDLVQIFDPLFTNKLTYNTEFYSTPFYNADVRYIFQAYTAGDPSANNTKYLLSNGVDLSQIFRKKTSIATSFPTQSTGPAMFNSNVQMLNL
jgi:hypothetical protein